MTNTKKPLLPKRPPPLFQVGDYVSLTIPMRPWMMIDHGTVTMAGQYNSPVGYFVEIQHGDHKLAVYESGLELVHRPQPTDGGADEYAEIMVAQNLMEKSQS